MLSQGPCLGPQQGGKEIKKCLKEEWHEECKRVREKGTGREGAFSLLNNSPNWLNPALAPEELKAPHYGDACTLMWIAG